MDPFKPPPDFFSRWPAVTAVAHTDPEVIERLAEQRGRTLLFGVCDSCHEPLDAANRLRLRHSTCPVPPLPEEALKAIKAASEMVVR